MKFDGWKIVVPREKLSEYLLSPTHLVGRSKAKFLKQYGFQRETVDLLEKGLIKIAQFGEVQEEIQSPYGIKQVIDGTLESPSGQELKMRTVWIEIPEQKILRLVTAYPERKENDTKRT